MQPISANRKTRSHRKSLNTKKNGTYADINPVLGFEQTQACGGIEPVNGITATFYNRISNTYRDINNQTTWPYSIPFKKTTHIKNDTTSYTSTSRGLWLWCLTPLSTIFQLYRGCRFIGGGNRSTWKKTPTCRKSLTNVSHYVISSTPRLSRVRTHKFSGDVYWLHR